MQGTDLLLEFGILSGEVLLFFLNSGEVSSDVLDGAVLLLDGAVLLLDDAGLMRDGLLQLQDEPHKLVEFRASSLASARKFESGGLFASRQVGVVVPLFFVFSGEPPESWWR